MNLLDIKRTLINIIKETPGVKGFNVYDFENLNAIDLQNDECLESIFAERTEKGWSIRCALTILRGLSAKRIVNEIYQQMNYILKPMGEKIYKLNIMIKGVSDE
ncbi:hypothetical protein [Mycoplasma crocodyli]|uniref:Uncharacterized protein n=1 Tax=Mycoplasma crocodyli (strain ATCC 51981 / MP145) TaxID=512564 RepID=D5E4P8_MYCCM|nr:hypothetical protein [Mycoplasma crocodyli]ADE19865.1 conserved hypothetical protein [Mycoplasma crocodyli MP145]